MSNQNGAQPGRWPQGPQFAPQHQTPQAPRPYPQAPQANGPYQGRPAGMTEEERVEHRNMILGGLALTAVPILIAVLLSAVDAQIDPKLTAPVLSALLIAGAATFGKAYRFKRDAQRR
ncbi:hypothetical protein [Glycomyces rhizosphaerae]|uniref:Uncharacterized protein n=1 Tax=Glycomyces rhizosphaerae TaxID=2054422 RepID=A0ABV7PXC5_9ACTN